MATYSVTTTAKQDQGLAAYRAEINAQRAAAGQAALTLAQTADTVFGRVLAARADRDDEDKRQRLRDAYATASGATQAQVDALLGVT